MYDFQPAILRTNKMINNEARCFLYEDNLFVLVTYSGGVHMYACMRTEVLSKIAAEKDKVLRFPSTLRTSMQVDLYLRGNQGSRVESRFVIAAKELWLFCRMLQWLDNEKPCFLSNLNIKLGIFPSYQLDIDASVTTGLRSQVVWNPRPLSQQRMLLEPFGTLHSIRNLTIAGMDGKTEHIDAQLMTDVKKRAGRLPKSMEEVLLTTNRIKDRGNEAFRAGDFWRARSLYKSASRNLNAGERYIQEAHLTDELTKYLCDHYQLGFRIFSNSIATLLRLQQWRDAHEMATRVIENISLTKDIAMTPYQDNELIKLYYRRALASEGMGKMTQAIEEIREALHVEPANREMKAKLREWKLETQSAKQVQATLKALTT